MGRPVVEQFYLDEVIGIDPSYTKTGYCRIDLKNKKILFKSISPPGVNKTYRDAYSRAKHISFEIIREANPGTNLIIEEPMVTSMMASRLGLLSGVLVRDLEESKSISKIYTVNPVTIKQLNSVLPKNIIIAKKAGSQAIVLEILNYLEVIGFTVEVYNDKLNKDGTPKQRKISHDESEAFLLAMLLVHKLRDNTESLTYDNWVEIYKIHKGFYTKDITIHTLEGEINE